MMDDIPVLVSDLTSITFFGMKVTLAILFITAGWCLSPFGAPTLILHLGPQA